ncbi:MAG: iron ABC transporter permease [Pseudomonadota bacterium]|nr:iron ABC transporter permease [Pseudomonadota bacterium]MEE3099308.1 iron ABC transporter permease [Pseudomonadota bacterium]
MSRAVSRPLALALLLAAATLIALMRGALDAPLAVLWEGLVTGEGPGALVLAEIRGPRVAAGLAAGAALGLSGAIFQTLFRNPLASPDLLGFTSGASLAVVAGMAAGLAAPPQLLAAAGGLAAWALIGALTLRRGEGAAPPLTLVLVGLGVGFGASACATFLMSALPLGLAHEAQRWITGSLAARGWDHAGAAWAALAALGLAAFAQVRALEALELGEAMAAGLGLDVARARRGVAATAVLLAAAGVAVAGPLPFVALMAGPAGARVSGARSPAGRLAAAAATGALVVVLADLVARAAVPGVQLPAGVATGLLGAPYLLWRLSREMEKGGL